MRILAITHSANVRRTSQVRRTFADSIDNAPELLYIAVGAVDDARMVLTAIACSLRDGISF